MAKRVNFERRSLELTPQQWEAIEQLATELKAMPPSGPAFGKPSWRTLIKEIANNTILLYKEPPDPQDPALGQDSE